ncbi:MAG TPA: hypothetical protein VFG87_15390 [Amycolatopsis sp.]|jgi:hypothetical protein|nr:hypothetical protein [Amycolatopsis sp.]
MTDESQGVEAAGPPWSVDLLADLHAGVLDQAETVRLWEQVNADPAALEIIEALAATTADLATVGSAAVPPMPDDVAARIDAALAEAARDSLGLAPVVGIDAARRRRNKRIGWATGVVAVAAAAVAAVVVALPQGTSSGGGPVAAPPPASQQAPLAVQSDHPEAAIRQLSTGVKDYGALGSADKLSACLHAAGFAAAANPIGVSPGTIDGQPAVLVLLTTGTMAQFRVVAFSPACGVGNAGVLLDKVVGG